MGQCILNFGLEIQNDLNKARILQIISLAELITFNQFVFKPLLWIICEKYVTLLELKWGQMKCSVYTNHGFRVYRIQMLKKFEIFHQFDKLSVK